MANSNFNIKRRDLIKGLATIPVLGAMAWGHSRKEKYQAELSQEIKDIVGMSYENVPIPTPIDRSQKIRIGLIGYGIRGKQLMRGAGFAHPSYIDDLRQQAANNPGNEKAYEDRILEFQEQDNLNIEINGVCDIFDTYATMAQEAGANINRGGSDSKLGKLPKRYLNYKELCAADDIDAVIIAAPDHWHAPMSMEAARNGKHVYCEKPMSWSVEETYEVTKLVKDNGIVFQLGHQGRQTESYIKAKEAVEKGVLGEISLVEVCTNRNTPNGAWVYPIHEDANPNTIDWEQFIGQAPWHDFSLERFFRWRCWWDYSTGLNGDLLTHEYDAINQILGVGIPHSAASSGGIYYFKDGRTVPDVLQVAYEFPKRNLTMLYSATLASQKDRGKVMMGHDGYMELGNNLTIYADAGSTKYAEKISDGTINTTQPIYRYVPGQNNADATTSATEAYFAGRGLLYTYRNGKRVDTTHLHIQEWVDAIRTNSLPSCNIDQGFQEAITAHMATKALRENRTVFWDEEKQEIV